MNPSLHLVFAGTPAFAVPTLEKLIRAGFPVSLVVTQPDRPSGRGMKTSPSPVKQKALDLGLPVIQPSTIRNNVEFQQQLIAHKPDAIIVVGYGKIIPAWMISLPSLGNINLHASLLPKYRGAAPIQWAIACGEAVTGVTTMRIDAGLDTGDILLQKAVPVEPGEMAMTLGARLAEIGAALMVETLRGLIDATIQPRPQDGAQATLAPTLKKEDGRIDFQRNATQIWNRLRGFQPWPGAFTTFRGRNLTISEAVPIDRNLPPGQLVVERDRLTVGCHAGTALELLTVQPEGKKRISVKDFIHGYGPHSGESFD
jgi:methionyl-tRNA formyltransferase